MSVVRTLGRRFARVATDAVVARPELWRVFRRPLRAQFNRVAGYWDEISLVERLAPLERALDALPRPPRRILDAGTGTGIAALLLARRFPEAHVTGIDLAREMVERARAKMPLDLAQRVEFVVGDAAQLPFGDAAFDLVVLANMIPFFDELDRVTDRDGALALNFSRGAETPIYVPPERVRAELARRGFADFAEFRVGDGVAILARRSGEE